jgi:hypothetical protein
VCEHYSLVSCELPVRDHHHARRGDGRSEHADEILVICEVCRTTGVVEQAVWLEGVKGLDTSARMNERTKV